MKYKVVLRHSDEGYSVSVPGLPGCWSQGATEEEAIENIRDAIHEYMMAEEDWNAIQETIYLLSINGMRESIREGLATPIAECEEDPDW